MIKINLLPQRKAKRRDPGQQSILVGFMAILAAGVLVFLLVHKPKQDAIASAKKANQKIEKKNKATKKKLANFDKIKAEVAALEKRKAAISVVDSARVTPANLLHELTRILSGEMPTMTSAMAKRVRNDPHRALSLSWDGKTVWIDDFKEKNGEFTLKGGAQSNADFTEFVKRLQASAYFQNVVPRKGNTKQNKDKTLTIYESTIKGKVAY